MSELVLNSPVRSCCGMPKGECTCKHAPAPRATENVDEIDGEPYRSPVIDFTRNDVSQGYHEHFKPDNTPQPRTAGGIIGEPEEHEEDDRKQHEKPPRMFTSDEWLKHNLELTNNEVEEEVETTRIPRAMSFNRATAADAEARAKQATLNRLAEHAIEGEVPYLAPVINYADRNTTAGEPTDNDEAPYLAPVPDYKTWSEEDRRSAG